MRIPLKLIAVSVVASITLAGLLVLIATFLFAIESSGRIRVAWLLLSAATLICLACCAAAVTVLPTLRQSFQRERSAQPPSPQAPSGAADVAAVRKAVDEIRRELRSRPDTARLHKVLEATSRGTVDAIGEIVQQALTSESAASDAIATKNSGDQDSELAADAKDVDGESA